MDFILYLLLTWKSYLPRDISVLDIFFFQSDAVFFFQSDS